MTGTVHQHRGRDDEEVGEDGTLLFYFQRERDQTCQHGPGLLELLGERRIQFSRVEIVLLETKVARLNVFANFTEGNLEEKGGNHLSSHFLQTYLRRLPAVEKLLQSAVLVEVLEDFPRAVLVKEIQDTIEEKREMIRQAGSEAELEPLDFSTGSIAAEVLQRVREKTALNLRPVINATGVLLHTNLGRAPLPRTAIEAIQQVGASFSNLEFSLTTGKRSSRFEHLEGLICQVTGAEAALVVNNNAGAVFLALNTLAAGKEVIVSRGELVEIGGSFRIPEVMAKSGAHLVEVGTTNKCHPRDYREALGDNTALFLKVHTSNYKIMGFTTAVPLRSLVKLAKEYRVPVMEDLGSGVLVDLSRYGLPHEPTVQESVSAGADLVMFSGDKLLGGPQAGIIVGKKRYVEMIKSNQLARALRVDKFALAGLEATLRLYLDEKTALREIPILRMLTTSTEDLEQRAARLLEKVSFLLNEHFQVGLLREKARVGGGSLPLVALPSCQISIEPRHMNAGAFAAKLRKAKRPVIARVRKNRVLLDLRSALEQEDDQLLSSLESVI